MADYGLSCPEPVHDTGSGPVVRYKAPGDSSKDAYYFLHLDGVPNGGFGHFAKLPPPGIKWHANGSKPADPKGECANQARAIEQANAEREAEAAAAAIKLANQRWPELRDADAEHLYCPIRKCIKAHGCQREPLPGTS